ncbi:MAG: site-specific tyrosine recombinase/integron integrase [Oscillospiraceae bacterium]
MKETIINSIIERLVGRFDSRQLAEIKSAINEGLSEYDVTRIEDENAHNTESNLKFLEMFISAKRVEGCAESTLGYYEMVVNRMFEKVSGSVKNITTDDLRIYLADHQKEHNASKVTIDNIRRVLSSFFAWLEDEDYILKSPVRRIHKVKTAKTIKETLTDEDLEVLRDNCTNLRNLVIVEMLSSTAVRVGELVKLNRSDIDFNERSCIVFGKGSKEREVYFDAKTKLHLQKYLSERTDDNPALFVSLNAPYERLQISGIQRIVRELGRQTNIKKVHPHKFRRTVATMAIDKGMPIEQVQTLLGHVKIETTMHYAMVNQSNVKIAHRKFIG